LFAAIALLGAACSGAAQPTQAQPKEKLVIAILPTASAETLAAESREMEKFLEARLGREVDIMVPTLYGGVIEALRFGHAHAAFLSAWPAALAAKNAGAEVALAEVREVVIGQEKQEKPFYFSYWVVRKDSPYQSLSDLRGKRVAFASPLSTSGYVFPLARLEIGRAHV
jgi:phosphonate transport system substrate-binding protein